MEGAHIFIFSTSCKLNKKMFKTQYHSFNLESHIVSTDYNEDLMRSLPKLNM